MHRVRPRSPFLSKSLPLTNRIHDRINYKKRVRRPSPTRINREISLITVSEARSILRHRRRSRTARRISVQVRSLVPSRYQAINSELAIRSRIAASILVRNDTPGVEGCEVETRCFGAGDVEVGCCVVEFWVRAGDGVVGFGVRDEAFRMGTSAAATNGEKEPAKVVVGFGELVTVCEFVELERVSVQVVIRVWGDSTLATMLSVFVGHVL